MATVTFLKASERRAWGKPSDRRRSYSSLWGAATLAFLLVAAAGCQSYLDDAAARTPGEVTDDLTIHTLVKTRLVRDRVVRGLRINVDVDKGVVTLAGKVRSESERQRAVEVATGIPSVVRVVDNLVVQM